MAKPIPITLVLAALAVTRAWAAESAETIDISLGDYAFTPAGLALKAGTAYRLHLVNAGSKDHDFTAPEFFAAAQIAPEDQAKVTKGKIAVDKGQAVDVTITPGAGSYKVSCTHFMHSMMGMHGTIAVQ